MPTGPAFGWTDNSTPAIDAANLELMYAGGYRCNVDTPEAHGAARDGSTDDTAAIVAAVNNVVSHGQADGSNYGEVWFTAGIYQCASATTKGGTTKGNAQIPLPAIDQTSSQKFTLVLRGVREGSAIPIWSQTPVQTSGVVIRSSLTGQTYDSTNGAPSIIGTPTKEQGYGYNTTWSNMFVVVDGITVIAPANPSIHGIDLSGVAAAHVRTMAALTNESYPSIALQTNGAWSGTTTQFACGLLMPVTGNNDNCSVDNYSCAGWYAGFGPGEHTAANTIRTVKCRIGVRAQGNAPHGLSIRYLSTEACRSHIYIDPRQTSASLLRTYLDIDKWDIEDDSGTFATTSHLTDTNSVLYGDLNYQLTESGQAFTTLQVTGGANARLRNAAQAPGAVSAPAVPSASTAFANPFDRDAFVVISGGTGVSVSVDGASIAATSVLVPPRKTINLGAYTVAPTWTWTLL